MSTSQEDREALNKFVSDVKIALDDKPAKKPASDPSFAAWNGIIEDREKRYFDDPKPLTKGQMILGIIAILIAIGISLIAQFT